MKAVDEGTKEKKAGGEEEVGEAKADDARRRTQVKTGGRARNKRCSVNGRVRATSRPVLQILQGDGGAGEFGARRSRQTVQEQL